jgi:aminopeptidase N
MTPIRKPLFRAIAATLFLAAAAPAVFAQDAAPAPRADNEYLSQQDAAARSARVSNVAYALDFQLTGEPSFSATSTIDFELSDASRELTVDLDKAKIDKLLVNGKALQPAYNQSFITLPADALKRGHNTVVVSFTREHSTNGEGLHRYVDKADGRVYLYSHFEPAAAHQMFASFDQPDLKATYTLTATAPKEWVVISSTRETKVDELGAMKRWHFPTTPKLSPYNFSMHAGPYKVWEDDSGKYPMRLFARQSLAKQVWPDVWFKYTRDGLAYYDQYFGVPYPFKKYDQVLVPQFIYGAMENAGAVTFTESRFISEQPMTAQRSQQLGGVILHEMAHQWFGDLVTMRWWNGLWLNESFASYMSTIGQAGSPDFDKPWLSQYRSKQGAYRTDESSSTHPIEVPVPSTANAFDNIDAITYTKGASTLHQLRQQIGAETFRRGVHDYLVKHSYQNATLDDFIDALAKAAGRDLKPWAQEWLYQPGVNVLAADFDCADGKISRFTLRQSAANPDYPTLREQLVQVALFDLDGGKIVLDAKAPVTYKGAATEVPALVGKSCPALVYPNYEDWGFAKVSLDDKSFATVRSSLSGTDDVMLRSMLWQSLADGLRDQRVALSDYIDAVLANAPAETDPALVRQALLAATSSEDLLRIYAAGNASPKVKQYAAAAGKRLEDMVWAGLLAHSGKRDEARTWFDTYVEVANSDAALARLRAILDGKQSADGVEIDQEFRWNIIGQLNRYDAPGSEALIAAELAKDDSEAGQLGAIAAAAVRPDAKAKSEWLAKIQALPTAELPYAKLRVAMASLYPAGQEAFDEASAEQRLQSMAKIDAVADRVFMRSYAGMVPATCTPASVERLEQARKSMGGLSEGVRRDIVSSLENDRRCVAVRAKFEGSL